MAHLQNTLNDVNHLVNDHSGEDPGIASVDYQVTDQSMESGKETKIVADVPPPPGINHRYNRLHPDIQPYAMMTKTCYMDYDPMSNREKVPPMFARIISPLIGSFVFLEDKNRNEIQVSVERKNGKLYFTDGWSHLRHFYDLSVGGWITLLFVSPLVFNIKVRKITGIEVDYPSRNPPFSFTFAKTLGGGPSNGPIPFFVLPKSFCHRLEKTLTSTNVQSESLVLFWKGFCESAFPHQQTELTLIDWLGNMWSNCHLQFEATSNMTCKISGGWRDICKMHRLTEGVTVKFGVTQPANNTVVYFKLAPFIGVRTTMIAPSTTGKRKIFYQTQQYFML